MTANGGPACNNPDKFTTYGAHSYGENHIYLGVRTVVDTFNVLNKDKDTTQSNTNSQEATNSSSCTAPGLRRYDHHAASGFYAGSGTPAECVLSSDSLDQTADCQTHLSFFFDSFTVETATSGRGTDWRRILLDEGSIVGGVWFVLWVLTGYVL